MKKYTFIIGTLLFLTGCGSDNSSSTTSDQNLPSNSENPVADTSTSFQNETKLVQENSIFIDCRYIDNFIVHYRIKDNEIASFNEFKNDYIKDVLYLEVLGAEGWSLVHPKDLNGNLNFKMNKDEIVLNFTKLEKETSIWLLNAHDYLIANSFIINRKTGTINQNISGTVLADGSFIVGRCTPGASLIETQNSF